MKALTLVLALAFLPLAASAQLTPGPNDVYVRVVDGGAGLCTVTAIPGPFYMVYDAGHWQGTHCLNAVRQIVDGDEIDLMVISHTDADHLGQADEILDEFFVYQIVRVGQERSSGAWDNFNQAVANEVLHGSSVTNLQTVPFAFGESIEMGGAVITFVAGWPEWTDAGPSRAERRNAVSIVVKLTYQNRTVLFTGDTIGKRLGDPDTACKDAEAVMVDNHNNNVVSLAADVIIAPHHGGNNGSSRCFIDAVDPTFVVFSAGHNHEHPTSGAAGRYLAAGVQLANMFRTDFGDDEGGSEWDHGRQTGCTDGRGDEDVEIVLRQNGTVEVAYRSGTPGC